MAHHITHGEARQAGRGQDGGLRVLQDHTAMAAHMECCCDRHTTNTRAHTPLSPQVRDLDFPITIIGVPIVREADGLAMSRCGYGWCVAGHDARAALRPELTTQHAVLPRLHTAATPAWHRRLAPTRSASALACAGRSRLWRSGRSAQRPTWQRACGNASLQLAARWTTWR